MLIQHEQSIANQGYTLLDVNQQVNLGAVSDRIICASEYHEALSYFNEGPSGTSEGSTVSGERSYEGLMSFDDLDPETFEPKEA